MNTKPQILFTPSIDDFIDIRKDCEITVLTGSNNSGKSYLLKNISSKLGSSAVFFACQRFYNTTQIDSRVKDPNMKNNIYSSFTSDLNSSNQNNENNYLDINSALTSLNKIQTDTLMKIAGELLGVKFKLNNVADESYYSPRYIEVGDYNLSFSSAGTRLLVIILATLLNDSFDYVLLDEPELGLTPRIQNKLVDFIYNKRKRRRYFPHLKQIYFATHSHIFLDRENVNNNFKVEKKSLSIQTTQITDIASFNQVQFNLLGNKLSTLFLPSAIIFVEGETDLKFIQKVIDIRKPGVQVVLFENQGSKYKERIKILLNLLGNFENSPYKDRIMIVLDSIFPISLKDELLRMGFKTENIIIWNKNGIEYYYPSELMKDIFNCSQQDLESMTIDRNGVISINNILKTKKELSDEIIEKMNSKVKYSDEFKEKFIKRLKAY